MMEVRAPHMASTLCIPILGLQPPRCASSLLCKQAGPSVFNDAAPSSCRSSFSEQPRTPHSRDVGLFAGRTSSGVSSTSEVLDGPVDGHVEGRGLAAEDAGQGCVERADSISSLGSLPDSIMSEPSSIHGRRTHINPAVWPRHPPRPGHRKVQFLVGALQQSLCSSLCSLNRTESLTLDSTSFGSCSQP